jgi:two-component system nitrogen regulation response regulator GlnG
MEVLRHFDWPGNVRQLENICRWITVMAPTQNVTIDDLPPELRDPQLGRETEAGWEAQLQQVVVRKLQQGESDILGSLGSRFERILLQTALQHTHGRKQEAARRLGWGRNTLTRKLKELGVEAS